MSDFLTRLAARQLGAEPSVTPRVPSRFAPAPAVNDVLEIVPATSAAAGPPTTESRHVVRNVEEQIRPTASPSVVDTPVAIRAIARERESTPRPIVTPSVASVRMHPVEAASAGPIPPVELPRPVDQPPRHAAPTETIRTEVARSAGHAANPPAEPRMRPLVPQVPLMPPRAIIRDAIAQDVSATDHRFEPPAVTVTIGRVEVRAIVTPPARERRGVEAPKALSLEEYLDRRRGGRR